MKEFFKKTSYALVLFFILLLSHHFSQDFGISSQTAMEPALHWHTYMGSSSYDMGQAIAIDERGNVYMADWSETTWGKPINPHSGDNDVFVAKLDKNGVLLWNTFLGSSGWDEGRGIAIDGNGNVYVVGSSAKSWGTPVHSHAGDTRDAFAAKLNSKGELKWHTFMGGDNSGDRGMAITVETSGNVYVGGFGGAFWDTDPVYPISSGTDGWLAKLDSKGKRQWYTPMGSSKLASIRAIALDTIGNICVVGWGEGPWFTRPVNPYAGYVDAFAAKLDSRGVHQWHTFMGSKSEDQGMGIAIDRNGSILVSGFSKATWGRPINPYAGKGDAFVAKLNSRGVRQWNTFMGSARRLELGWAIAADTLGNVYASGEDPIVKLNHAGVPLWSTSMMQLIGEGNSIAVDPSGNVYVGCRGGEVPWVELPVNPYAGSSDAMAVKIDRGIRVMSWNLLNYSGLNEDSRDEDIRKVLKIIEPDVVVIQEMESTFGVDHFLKKVLNANSRRKYKAAQFYDGPDTDNALFYDKSRLNLKSHKQIPTSFRDISEFSLKIKKGPSEGSEFKLYSVHFTEGRGSSYKKQRENQADTLRTHLNGLLMDSVFLVCGTFNMTTSQEKAYKILTGSQADSIGGNIGRLKDLIKKSGKWYNRTKFKHTHTESTRKAKFGGGAGGGLDDRYDMILVSYRLDQNSELTYMPGSYIVCGNDGKHLNKSINDPENKIISSDIADALYKASDHLPVIIDLVKMKDAAEEDSRSLGANN